MHDYIWLFYLYKYPLDHFIYIYQAENIHALHDITVHFIPLRCIELQYITLHYIALHTYTVYTYYWISSFAGVKQGKS